MQAISHYTVHNHHTGTTRTYKSGVAASRAADRGDQAYGAICCTRKAVWVDIQEAPDSATYRTTPATIAAEHQADMAACGVAI